MSVVPLQISFPDPARNKSGRRILLIEPIYRNKYPPLGLMKLSAYHKKLGDSVTFLKGHFSKYILDEKFDKCIAKIRSQDFALENWDQFELLVRDYLRSGRLEKQEEILKFVPEGYFHIVKHHLTYYKWEYMPERQWDRVYVTTLFTFYWNHTIDAISFAKKVVKSVDSLYVGGVAASLISDIIADETNLVVGKNILVGLLDRPGILDDNDIVIDEIIPDYSILETIDHHYPLDTGYLTYMTKGCTRTCSFCAVPKLEPVYKEKISIKDQILAIAEKHGERKDLILMDNNVLGSPKFPEIVQEILDMGFSVGSKYVNPNRLEILIEYLLAGDNDYNEKKYLEKAFLYLENFGIQRIKNVDEQALYYQLLRDNGLDTLATFTKENLFLARHELNEFVEKYRNKRQKLRYVDFNQGIDCRYVNEENMELLSRLPIRPMRIAFDHIGLRDTYEKAVRLADKYGIRTLSNYILFNYHDKPEDLWERLRINLELNRELESTVYSFPMKYIPVYGDNATNRKFLGKHWNRKYIRAIQCILNATRGVVTVNPEFFYRAFGENLDEYFKLMMMPEAYILFRSHFEQNGQTEEWWEQLESLNSRERAIAEESILLNNFSCNGSTPRAVVEVMKHYEPIRGI